MWLRVCEQAADPSRVFTADAQGVIRSWSVMADKEGRVNLMQSKSMDLATMMPADLLLAKAKLPIQGKSTNDKENTDTQKRLKALTAMRHVNEEHGAYSVVCIRAHEAGQGSQIATMSVDSLIRILDALSLKVLWTLSGFVCTGANACLKCSWSPDGRLLAAGSEDGRLVVWNVPQPLGLSATLTPLQSTMFVGQHGPQNCQVIQPGYQRKGECTGVTWSGFQRDLAVCCLGLGSAAPVVLLTYIATLGVMTLEKASDILVDSLEGAWSQLAPRATWGTPLTYQALRRIVVRQQSYSHDATLPLSAENTAHGTVTQHAPGTVTQYATNSFESALSLVFDVISSAAAGGGGKGAYCSWFVDERRAGRI